MLASRQLRARRAEVTTRRYARDRLGGAGGAAGQIGAVVNPGVDTYIERSDQSPEDMKALPPMLLGCGLTEEIR